VLDLNSRRLSESLSVGMGPRSEEGVNKVMQGVEKKREEMTWKPLTSVVTDSQRLLSVLSLQTVVSGRRVTHEFGSCVANLSKNMKRSEVTTNCCCWTVVLVKSGMAQNTQILLLAANSGLSLNVLQ
jgi:hypothetical protein